MSIGFSSGVYVWSSVSAMVFKSKICSSSSRGLDILDCSFSVWACMGDCVGVVNEDMKWARLNRFVGDLGEKIVVFGTSTILVSTETINRVKGCR